MNEIIIRYFLGRLNIILGTTRACQWRLMDGTTIIIINIIDRTYIMHACEWVLYVYNVYVCVAVYLLRMK